MQWLPGHTLRRTSRPFVLGFPSEHPTHAQALTQSTQKTDDNSINMCWQLSADSALPEHWI